MPDAAEVAYAEVSSVAVPLRSEEGIEEVVRLHQTLVAAHAGAVAQAGVDSRWYVSITYHLRDGQTVSRSYDSLAGAAGDAVGQFLQSDALRDEAGRMLDDVLGTGGPTTQEVRLTLLGEGDYVDGFDDASVAAADRPALLAALQQDVAERGARCMWTSTDDAETLGYLTFGDEFMGSAAEGDGVSMTYYVELSREYTPATLQWIQERYGVDLPDAA